MREVLEVGYPYRKLPAGVRPPWKAGEEFDQTDAQREMHLSDEPLILVSAGYRAGKTRGLVMEAIFLAIENLRCVVLLVSPTYRMSRDVIEVEMVPALEDAGLVEGRHWRFAKTDRTYQLFGGVRRGGSDIRLRSGEDPRKLVGPTVAAALLDEPALMKAEVLRFVRSRVSDAKARRRVTILAGTPDPGTWFSKLVSAPPDDARVIFARTDSNPWIDAAYLDGLRSTFDAKALEAYMAGRPVSLTGNAYHAFSDANVKKCTYDPSLPLYFTMDNNRNPLVAVLLQKRGSEIHAVGEIFIRGGSWPALAEATHQRLGGVMPAGIYLHGDADCRNKVVNEDTDWGYFSEVRARFVQLWSGLRTALRAPKANPFEANRLVCVNSLLCNVRGERRLFVDPSCKELIADLREMEVNEEGRLKKPGRPGGGAVDKMRSHVSDALGYACAAEWPAGTGDRTRRPALLSVPLKP